MVDDTNKEDNVVSEDDILAQLNKVTTLAGLEKMTGKKATSESVKNMTDVEAEAYIRALQKPNKPTPANIKAKRKKAIAKASKKANRGK